MEDKAKEIKNLKQEAGIMATQQFRKKIRDLLYKEGIIRSPIDLSKIDFHLKNYFNERISVIEKKIKQPEPLDEIFISEEEMKLRKELAEQKSINEHLRNIYKRDITSWKKMLRTKIDKIKEKYPTEIQGGDWEGIYDILEKD